MIKKFKNLFYPLILLIIVIFFFLPFLGGTNIPYVGDFTGSDLTELNLPLRFLAGESFKDGQVPLWSNLLANGFPVLAEGQAGVFYPLNIIFFTLLPFVWAVNLTFVANFFLAGFFTYLYSRVIKISQAGSLLAAVAFSFSGFFIFRLKHLNLINAAIWLPLQFYLVEKFFSSKKKLPITILLSIVFTIQFLAGHPQIFYISAISSFLYFCLKVFSQENFKVKDSLFKIFTTWSVVGILVFGLSAIQLIPTFFYSYFSGRSLTVDYSQVIDFAYNAPSLLMFIFPYIFGNPALHTFPADIVTYGIFWENNIYFGLLPLLFSVIGIIFVSVRKKAARLLTILFFISLLFLWGDSSPVFAIFWELLPGFTMFRFPQRFLLLSLLTLTVLAGFGFDFLWNRFKVFIGRFKKLSQSKLLFNSLLPLVIVLVVAFDLFVVDFKYVGILNYEDYFSSPQSATFIKEDSTEDQDVFRVTSLKWPMAWISAYALSGGWQNNLSIFISERELIPPNLNVFWDVASSQDRASLEGGLLNQQMHNLNNVLMNQLWLVPDEDGNLVITDRTLEVLGLQNVKYLLSYENIQNDNLVLAKEIQEDFLPTLKIYQNNFQQPFAFGVFNVKYSASIPKMLELMFDADFDPAEQIILSKDTLRLGQDVEGQTATVNDLNLSDGQVELSSDFSHPGYLYISQTFMPGWKAFIDGSETEVLRANYAFSAIAVPEGQHEVKLIYEPISYSIGKWITIFTSLLLVMILIFYIYYDSRSRHK